MRLLRLDGVSVSASRIVGLRGRQVGRHSVRRLGFSIRESDRWVERRTKTSISGQQPGSFSIRESDRWVERDRHIIVDGEHRWRFSIRESDRWVERTWLSFGPITHHPFQYPRVGSLG